MLQNWIFGCIRFGLCGGFCTPEQGEGTRHSPVIAKGDSWFHKAVKHWLTTVRQIGCLPTSP